MFTYLIKLTQDQESMHNKNKGYFITLEGGDGLGKSTACAFIQQLLTEKKLSYIVTREPGGTEIAEAIRNTWLAEYDETMASDTELLLVFASRAQHIAQVIKPALCAGKYIICDRFTDASYAYQGAGQGTATDRIAILEQWVHHDLQPDLTLLLDAPIELTLQRLAERQSLDRIEQQQAAFFQRVRDCYLQRAKQYPQRFRLIDATQSLEQVQQQIRTIIEMEINASR